MLRSDPSVLYFAVRKLKAFIMILLITSIQALTAFKPLL